MELGKRTDIIVPLSFIILITMMWLSSYYTGLESTINNNCDTQCKLFDAQHIDTYYLTEETDYNETIRNYNRSKTPNCLCKLIDNTTRLTELY